MSGLQNALHDMMAVEMLARERELYAAWRAGYDYLYVLSDFTMTDLSLEFIPSDDPNRRFPCQHTERYDIRPEMIEPEARQFLMEYNN